MDDKLPDALQIVVRILRDGSLSYEERAEDVQKVLSDALDHEAGYILGLALAGTIDERDAPLIAQAIMDRLPVDARSWLLQDQLFELAAEAPESARVKPLLARLALEFLALMKHYPRPVVH